MARWRLAAANTHLYAGARLHCLDPQGPERLAKGDRVVLEFSDGNVVLAEIAAVATGATTLAVPAFVTARGAPVAPRAWRLGPGRTAGELRVLGKATA